MRLTLNTSGAEQWTEMSHYPAINLRTANLSFRVSLTTLSRYDKSKLYVSE